jgi:hypothetical protein
MDNLKPFDPTEIDETLTKVVTHEGKNYLLFPFVNALNAEPRFNSVNYAIGGSAASVADFEALAALVRKAGNQGEWCISFNTPWLLTREAAAPITLRSAGGRPRR